MRFLDREDAGRQLAEKLSDYAGESPIVLGLPRGGVPVAYEVAQALGAPLDVWIVRKVGAPGYPELGIGAVAEGGIVFLSSRFIRHVGATRAEIDALVRQKSEEVGQRVRTFRGDLPPPTIEGRTVILVDDGIATGGTVRAAVQALRVAKAKKVVLAVPVAATQALDELAPLVDDVACLYATPELVAIGAWYDDFHQVPDRDVVQLLQRARKWRESAEVTPAPKTPPGFEEKEVLIPVEDAVLSGTLSGPRSPSGLVIFAHGSGSSRFSPRNRHVASVLHGFGLATLLFDLLTVEEEALDEQTAELRFDIALLAKRLVHVTDWAAKAGPTRGRPIGYFGSSTGAAAALVAAAERPSVIHAVVSRGGRPDLAGDRLSQVRAPTLLLVGGWDRVVIGLNHTASGQMTAPCRLTIIPGATHLFEEPGALDKVAQFAGQWFAEHLARAQPAAPAGEAPSAP